MLKLRESRGWLVWTVLFLAVMMLAVMSGSGLETSEAAPSQAIEVEKEINVSAIEPGQAPAPIYTVTFSNSTGADIVLDAVTDTLPAGFEFIDMHSSSTWPLVLPTDMDEPEIVWTGPFTVPANGEVTFAYSVDVPLTVAPSDELYTNTVEAMADGGTLVGPATAGLLVGVPDVSVSKEVTPVRVLNGDPVVYTVEFSNTGQLTGTLDSITDTLDASLTFGMVVPGSDITATPQISGNMLIWNNVDLPPHETLILKYKVQTAAGNNWSWPRNHVETRLGDETFEAETMVQVGPERAYVFIPALYKNFRYAYLTVAKTANPLEVSTDPGQIVTYTVVIENTGDTTGTLTSVYDLLPAGFTFDSMAPGSDIAAAPIDTAGALTWNGSWNMPPGHEMQVIYRAIANQTEGDYVNYVNVTADNATVPTESAFATVKVRTQILLEDNFNSGMAKWTEFLNYWRLTPEQWYHGPTDGVGGSGAVTQNCTLGKPKPERGAEDALLMYLGEGSENWTDYRVETKFLLRGGINEGEFILEGGHPIGLWVRGQYQDVGNDDTAGWVTGYYVVVGGKSTKQMYVKLAQLQTLTDCWDQACDNPHNLYDFNNPHSLVTQKLESLSLQRHQWYTLVVEVRGNRIQAWVNDVQAIDYVDEKEPFLTGTVGFKTYKSWTASFDDIIVTPLEPLP